MEQGSHAVLRVIGARIEGMGRDLEQVRRAMIAPARPTASEILDTAASGLGLTPDDLFYRTHRE